MPKLPSKDISRYNPKYLSKVIGVCSYPWHLEVSEQSKALAFFNRKCCKYRKSKAAPERLLILCANTYYINFYKVENHALKQARCLHLPMPSAKAPVTTRAAEDCEGWRRGTQRFSCSVSSCRHQSWWRGDGKPSLGSRQAVAHTDPQHNPVHPLGHTHSSPSLL